MSYTAYKRSTVTGGTVSSLDGIDGTALADGDVGLVFGANAYFYMLDADSGATPDGLNIVSPVTNAGNKRWILSPSNTMPPGHIDGLETSHAADTDHDITVAVGACRNDTNTFDCVSSAAMTKQIDATWAKGTNAGGLVSGSVANNTLYLFGMIRKDADGAIDFCFNTTATAPTDWTWMRTLMAYKTDGSANILAMDCIFRGATVTAHFRARFSLATGLVSTLYAAQSTAAVTTGLNQVEVLFGAFSTSGSTATDIYLSHDGTNTKTIFVAVDASQGVGSNNELYGIEYASPVFIPVFSNSVYYKLSAANATTLLVRAIRFKR